MDYYLQRAASTQTEAERLLAGARDLEESIGVSLSARRFEVCPAAGSESLSTGVLQVHSAGLSCSAAALPPVATGLGSCVWPTTCCKASLCSF